ncbi:hypothetical protein ACVWXU_000841 [Streptomyces sp. TE33382]
MSRTVRASGPRTESPIPSEAAGPAVTSPRLGLSPTTPQALAGERTDPAVSLPCASGTSRAPTAAAAPPLLPAALRLRSNGLRAGLDTSGSV